MLNHTATEIVTDRLTDTVREVGTDHIAFEKPGISLRSGGRQNRARRKQVTI